MITFCNFANFAFKEFVLKIIVMYIALGTQQNPTAYTPPQKNDSTPSPFNQKLSS